MLIIIYKIVDLDFRPVQQVQSADKGGGSECTISRQEEGANECKIAQIFAFGENCLAFDADQKVDGTGNADN